MIKRKKMEFHHRYPLIAAATPYEHWRQRRAIVLLRQHKPAGIIELGDDCHCSYATRFVAGSSVMSARKEGPAVCSVSSGPEALRIVSTAARHLETLHALGVCHGDPGLRNLIHGANGVFWIDLDNVSYIGWAARAEQVRFISSAAIPLLRRFYTYREVARCVLALPVSWPRIGLGVLAEQWRLVRRTLSAICICATLCISTAARILTRQRVGLKERT